MKFSYIPKNLKEEVENSTVGSKTIEEIASSDNTHLINITFDQVLL